MSDVNEVRRDEEQLEKALAYVTGVRPKDKELQTKYRNTEDSYDSEIAPLQKEFSEKLKEYTELSNQYYGEYVGISVSQNEKRQSTYDKQLNDYENYNNTTEAERQQNVRDEQVIWKKEQQTLDDQYDNAKIQYGKDVDKWKKQKEERTRLIEEAKSGLMKSNSWRKNWSDQTDPDYFSKTATAFAKRSDRLLIDTTSTTNYKSLGIQYLKNHGIDIAKRVAVVDDAAAMGMKEELFGIVGPGSKREKINLSVDHVLIYVGKFSRGKSSGLDGKNTSTIGEGNSNVVKTRLPFKNGLMTSGFMQYLQSKKRGSPRGGGRVTSDIKKQITGDERNAVTVHGLTRRGERGSFGYNDTFSAWVHGDYLYVERPGHSKGWGQQMFLYVGKPSFSLGSSTGRPTIATIWGSALKDSPVWGRKVFNVNQFSNLTLDTVPRWISYPYGPWDSNEPLHKQENWGTAPKGVVKLYYNVFHVDYEKINDPTYKYLWIVGAADDDVKIWVNKLTGSYITFSGGWGGRPKKLRMSDDTKIHTGPNMIFATQVNGGGPAGLAIALCQGTKYAPNLKKLLTATNPNWMALKANIKVDDLNTDHRVNNSTENRYDSQRWLTDFDKTLHSSDLLGRVPGAYGVKLHEYQPPGEKVQFIRIKFGSIPASRFIILNQIEIYSVDRYNVNSAKNAFLKSSKLTRGSAPLNRLIDGKPTTNQFVNIDDSVPWKDQFIEVALRNPIEVYKVSIQGPKGSGKMCANYSIEMYNRNRDVVFIGPPFGDDSIHHELYFNNPIIPEGSNTQPSNPNKNKLARDFPIFTPGKLPPYPIMPAYETPNEELLEKLIMLSDDLITLNLRIQSVYKKYIMNGNITRYQSGVLQRRRDLVTEVTSLIKERKKLNTNIDKYSATRKNQIDQEKRAISSQIYFWIWGCVSIIVVSIVAIYLMFPKYMIYTPQVISWGIISLVTLLTTIFIGGSITFMLWLFIVISILLYLFKKYMK